MRLARGRNDFAALAPAGVTSRTYSFRCFRHCLGRWRERQMYLIQGLILLAIAFFIVLPVTDAKTVRMKLSVAGSLGALLAASVAVPLLMH